MLTDDPNIFVQHRQNNSKRRPWSHQVSILITAGRSCAVCAFADGEGTLIEPMSFTYAVEARILASVDRQASLNRPSSFLTAGGLTQVSETLSCVS